MKYTASRSFLSICRILKEFGNLNYTSLSEALTIKLNEFPDETIDGTHIIVYTIDDKLEDPLIKKEKYQAQWN